ncbi:MAG: hypothetical protein R6V27_05965 [Balneolaceae bacterium]
MKHLSTLFLILFLVNTGEAQSLSAEYTSDQSSLSVNEFPLVEGILNKSSDTYQFGQNDNVVTIANPLSFTISGDREVAGAVVFSGELTSTIYSYDGAIISETVLENADSGDETLSLTVTDTGEFTVRDNVANFSFFDAAGNRAFTYSNSSQAQDGELPSGIETSDDGLLKVVYNPVIRYGEQEGSRASIIVGDRDAEEVFAFQDRVIDSLWLSADGQWIHAITANESGGKRVHMYDRFGNTVLEMDPDINVGHYSLSDDGDYMALIEGSRVQVFERSTGERLGSATSRSEIVKAAYFPDQNLVLAIGGQRSEGTVSNPEITAIDLQQRQLERFQVDGSFSFMNFHEIKISQESGGTYRVEGINRPMLIKASF